MSIKNYEISLEDLELEVIIGILEKERENKQKIKIDARFIYQKKEEFLDYRHLREFIKNAFNQKFLLLEDALEYFYREIPRNFPQIERFSLRICKLEIFEDCKVCMQISYP
ncbi:dihydroneopterin aldolase [Helicobacter burdigaliensis]|uniref:dihydroneopterin aldolase n=1 Tax=Helicobacter burdigaliensis TaxID=2315334 RepID=UPI000EF70EB0|nr:dihydroneopterin aldolase [Helicobacter burdigaliensis]